MDSSPEFYNSALGSLHSRCWGGQCVIFHVGSGDTHLLSEVDFNVLQSMKSKPMSAEGLSLEFEHLFGDRAGQYIPMLLSNLLALGLIAIIDNESAS